MFQAICFLLFACCFLEKLFLCCPWAFPWKPEPLVLFQVEEVGWQEFLHPFWNSSKADSLQHKLRPDALQILRFWPSGVWKLRVPSLLCYFGPNTIAEFARMLELYLAILQGPSNCWEIYRGMTKLSLFMKKRVVQSWRAGLHRCNTLQHLFVLCGRAKWIHMWKFTERFWHYSKQVWKWTNCSKLLSTNLLLILRKQKDSRNVHLLALKFTEICLSTLQRKRSLYLLPFPKSMRRCIVLWLPSTWTLDLHGASDKKTAWMCAEFWQKAAVKESRVL